MKRIVLAIGAIAISVSTGTVAASPGAAAEDIARAYANVASQLVWIGAFLTGLLWKAATSGLGWYMRDMSRFTRVNGSIAAVLLFLVWVYVQAVILLYGVEFTAAYARLRRGRPEEVPAAPTPRT